MNSENTDNKDFAQSDEISPTQRKRRSEKAPPKRKPIKKRLNWKLFLMGFLTGVIFSSLFSLLLPDKKIDPTPPPASPTIESEIPLAPEVNEIIIEEEKPEALRPDRNHSNAASEYAYDVEEVNNMIYSRSADGEKMVFLTFDDGPGSYTGEILDVLKEKETPATFFLLGNQAAKTSKGSELWTRYIEEGHALALHTYTHDYNLLYQDRKPNVDVFLEEWDKTHEILKGVYGDEFNTRVLRFPGGATSWKDMTETKEQLKEHNIYDIDWNAMSGDSESRAKRPATAEESWDMIQDNLKRTSNSDVVVLLMHDTKEDTAKFLGEIIEKFKEEGYKFGILY